MIKRIKDWRKRHNEKTERRKAEKPKREKVWRVNPFALGLFIARRIWFFGLFIFLGLFVKNNWEKCVDFSQLSGYNLLFIVFILLMLLPLLTGFKLSALGVGVEATAKPDSATEIAERIKSEAKAEDVSNKAAADLSNDLAKELAEIGSQSPAAGNKSKGGRRK